MYLIPKKGLNANLILKGDPDPDPKEELNMYLILKEKLKANLILNANLILKEELNANLILKEESREIQT